MCADPYCHLLRALKKPLNFGGGDLALENDRLSLGYTGYYEGLKRNNNEFLTNNHNIGRFEEVEEVEEDNYYGNHEVEEIEAFELKLNT
ncbi:9224_t:CDS:2 [Rhizophagus irregularis]|nr:9224_t:CDS:2 [Rhizophagus irregularis]